ncbi:ATP-binding protein [Psychrosphaera aestuarii]|uniref:ATP-binding protein n=1 Tax=Psychrosphaera aestuarii TaxID=1266052 RepID=UPI001B31B19F|nr:ATP-binding protein [Psychrosphaera aestuarii]
MSIQRQLTLLILATVTLATFFAGLYGYKSSAQQLDNFFDKELQAYSSILLTQSAYQTDFISPANQTLQFQIWRGDRLIAKSANAPKQRLSNSTRGFDDVSVAGKRWRIYVDSSANSIVGDNEKSVVAIVAHANDLRLAAAESVLIEAIAPLVVALPIIAFFVFYFIRKSLKPLVALSNALTSKNSNDLTQIDINNAPKELSPVINHLNELLRRLSQAFVRERQLSANTAHELRTPVSVLNINLHNALQAFNQSNLSRENIQELQSNTDRLAHVIEQIIALHRFTEENFNEHRVACDVEQILQQVIAQNYNEISVKSQTIELSCNAQVVIGHEFALSTMFENILKNAIKYTPNKGSIFVSVVESDAHNHPELKDVSGKVVEISFEDSGAGVSQQDLDKLTERFYRAKLTEAQKGSGLGLSIVKHIVELHKGVLKFANSPLGGLKVTVLLEAKQGIE